jgi:acyl carrier protein
METKEKMALLEDMLELDEGTLTSETELATLESWDSIAAISLLALLDEKFDKNITSQQLKSLKTIGDILALM